jgi:hypothetical protein
MYQCKWIRVLIEDLIQENTISNSDFGNKLSARVMARPYVCLLPM